MWKGNCLPSFKLFCFLVSGVTVLIDSKAQLTLLGTEMDYETDQLKSEFVFNNPNIKGTCGCGESFSIWDARTDSKLMTTCCIGHVCRHAPVHRLPELSGLLWLLCEPRMLQCALLFEMLIARAKDSCIIKRVYFVDVLVYLFGRFLFLLASVFCLEEL